MQPAPDHTDDGQPYIGVAIDHGASFERWLSRWNAGTDARITIKTAIASICLAEDISGLVVGVDLLPVLDRLVGEAAPSRTDVWLGVPDQTFPGPQDLVRSSSPEFPVHPAVWAAHAAGARGVKIGIGLGANATWGDVGGWMDSIATVSDRLGLELIIEPYFRADDDARTRSTFLAELGHFQGVAFVKLDVFDVGRWSPVYSGSPKPWLARSQGLEFEDYLKGVSESVGCAGTMVGAAVWGVDEFPVLGGAHVAELQRRLSTARRVFGA